MIVRLISHINGDGDLLEAWLKYYTDLGVSSFHLIVHGPPLENAQLFTVKDRYPITIEDNYDGEFSSEEKLRRTNWVLKRFPNQWLLIADSDEFVELPYQTIASTIRTLELFRGNVLYAPMLQRMTADGSLDSADVISDPFRMFPLCSESLYAKIGNNGSVKKFPLFYCAENTTLVEEGNHNPPSGVPPASRTMLGVTHHFKFRKPLLARLKKRINSSHSWRHESKIILNYLESHDHRLPIEDSFLYSRRELIRRGLLRRFDLRTAIQRVSDKILKEGA